MLADPWYELVSSLRRSVGRCVKNPEYLVRRCCILPKIMFILKGPQDWLDTRTESLTIVTSLNELTFDSLEPLEIINMSQNFKI